MRRFALCGVAVLMLGAGLLLVPVFQEAATAETGVTVTDKCAPEADALRFNALLLLDASGSLETTDPTNARRDGLEAITNSLASLERTWAHLNQAPGFNFEINVAVDTFATGYTRHHGWEQAGVSQLELLNRYDDITALRQHYQGSSTDYRQALVGASQRFSEVPSEGCHLLLWFTDGEHNEGELRDMCWSGEMALLSERNLWSHAVFLSNGSPSDAALRLLFGDLSEDCTYELDGEISHLDAEGLVSTLHELIAEAVREVVCSQQTPDLLPGEEHACPTQESEPCADDNSIPGNGTAASPCLYRFTLTPDAESFRLSVDMTYINRGIINPGEVKMQLQSPSGKKSDPISFAADDSAGYQPVAPFWFLSRRLYDSRWEVIAHQAAEQLAQGDDWEWAGEWTMLFWGDSAAAAEDAAKAAAAIKVNTKEAPIADMTLNEQGRLVGFIQNFPQEYQSVELRLRLNDGVGAPVYSTRPHLDCEQSACNPLPVEVEQGHRYEVPNLGNEILWWDTDEAGGDGMRLSSAVDQHGLISAVAELKQEFLYGGADGYGPDGARGQPLRWRRDVGMLEIDLTQQFEDQQRIQDERQKDQQGIDEAKRQWEDLQAKVEEMETGEEDSLPLVSELDDQPGADVVGKRVKFDVEAKPGYFPGLATLKEARLQVDGQAASKLAEREEWTCSIPGTWDGGSDAPVECGDLHIDLGLSQDATATAEMDFAIHPADGLEDALRASATYEGTHLSWEPPVEEWQALWHRIEQVMSGGSQTRSSKTFDVLVPTVGDKFREFLPILILLIALAALARVLAAWWLRPWSPLGSAEYVVQPLDDGSDGFGAAVTGLGPELSMALARRSASAQVGGLRLFSMWKPLLLGGPPRLVAKSSNRHCIGTQGRVATRKGEQLGLIGSHLAGGWVVENSPAGQRLIVWDLPADAEGVRDRLSNAMAAASNVIQQMRGAASVSFGTTLTERSKPAAVPPIGNEPFATVGSGHDSNSFPSGNPGGQEVLRPNDPLGQDPFSQDPFA